VSESVVIEFSSIENGGVGPKMLILSMVFSFHAQQIAAHLHFDHKKNFLNIGYRGKYLILMFLRIKLSTSFWI
jgi:hypothetical protein